VGYQARRYSPLRSHLVHTLKATGLTRNTEAKEYRKKGLGYENSMVFTHVHAKRGAV